MNKKYRITIYTIFLTILKRLKDMSLASLLAMLIELFPNFKNQNTLLLMTANFILIIILDNIIIKMERNIKNLTKKEEE